MHSDTCDRCGGKGHCARDHPDHVPGKGGEGGKNMLGDKGGFNKGGNAWNNYNKGGKVGGQGTGFQGMKGQYQTGWNKGPQQNAIGKGLYSSGGGGFPKGSGKGPRSMNSMEAGADTNVWGDGATQPGGDSAPWADPWQSGRRWRLQWTAAHATRLCRSTVAPTSRWWSRRRNVPGWSTRLPTARPSATRARDVVFL